MRVRKKARSLRVKGATGRSARALEGALGARAGTPGRRLAGALRRRGAGCRSPSPRGGANSRNGSRTRLVSGPGVAFPQFYIKSSYIKSRLEIGRQLGGQQQPRSRPQLGIRDLGERISQHRNLDGSGTVGLG